MLPFVITFVEFAIVEIYSLESNEKNNLVSVIIVSNLGFWYSSNFPLVLLIKQRKNFSFLFFRKGSFCTSILLPYLMLALVDIDLFSFQRAGEFTFLVLISLYTTA